MRAGRLRNKIAIEQLTETKNALGEPVETWSTFKTIYAQITPVNGKEYFAAAQTQSTVTHKIKIRHIEGVTTKMRVNFEGRLFDIEAVINFQEANKEIEIMAVERV